MLSKLIKHDIRSTWRDFVIVYLSIFLGVLAVPPFFNNIENNIVKTLLAFISFGIVTATIVVLIAMLFRIFNKNVYSKEGYLTMTLPVTSKQIVVAKLLVSSMWIILTGIVSAIGLFIFLYNINAFTFPDVAALLKKLTAAIDSYGVMAIILTVIAFITSSVKEIAKLFLACSISHMKQLGRFRTLLGIMSYFVLSWMESLIGQAVGYVFSLVPYGAKLTLQFELMNDVENIGQNLGLFSGVMAVGIIYSIILMIVYSIGNIWIMNHKLELE